MPVTDSFFYPQVKNKPCVHRAYAFILEFSTVTNSNIYCLCIMLCAKVNTFSPLQVKNKPGDGESEHAFILASMDHTIANNYVQPKGCLCPGILLPN